MADTPAVEDKQLVALSYKAVIHECHRACTRHHLPPSYVGALDLHFFLLVRRMEEGYL